MPDPTPLETVDLLIVGAGFHGLSLAATYTTTHPSASLLILDAAPSIGGVWAQSRLYPGLKTNSQAGHFEFADYPMLGNPRYPEVRADEHIAGDSVRRYLKDYAAEKGLVGRVRCGRKVVEAEDLGAEGWVVSVEEGGKREEEEEKGEKRPQRIHARILVLATGLTSTPKPPSSLLKCADADTSAFTGPIYHVRDFGKHCPSSAPATTDEKKNEKKKTILILSANKSAADCAHHHAHTLGNRVIWLIRPSGHGPCFLAPARVTPLKLLSEALITTRAVTFLNPCIWAAANPSSPSCPSPSPSPSPSSPSTSPSTSASRWQPPSFNHFEHLCRTLLHRTPAGRALVRAFHAQLVQRKGVEEPLRLDAHPQTALLKPWHDAFWVGTGRGLLNWGPGAPDVFELVRRGKIEVRLGEVVGMEGRTVRLSAGGDGQKGEGGEEETVVEVDEVVCSAGWEYRPSVRLVRGGVDISAELGVPGAGGREEKVVGEEDEAALVARADEEVLTALPGLREQPPQGRPPHLRKTSEPKYGTDQQRKKTLDGAYALYRFMIPPRRIHTRTLAFAGVVRTPVTATIAEMQALWLCAFFDHRLPHLEPSTIPPSPSSLKPDAAPSPKLSTPAVEKGPDDVKLHDDQQQQRDMREMSARVRYDAILHARYGAWRYPAGFGGVLPDFFFDTLPLFDLMLAELGLPRWRKGGFVKEVFSSYGPHDYRGLVEEWMELWKDERGGGRVEEGCGMGTVVVVCVALVLWVAVTVWFMGWVWSMW
ncbi:Flavin-binding monooxygenase-like protein [Lasiodiplodia theobromae]|uniref:Flavin-binding monooxygenase-like protein n=1 Tax=Lasiodiplodia theobromae TaxID=45133 RepID=UPI0015C4009A|nr:Flavin-binding monooxygenase-like protein [Lasiodiplodia theobromae]KAF4545420.1 Flavin-binding monooxygenase-like protein [Lasiodiplodia theobromae]